MLCLLSLFQFYWQRRYETIKKDYWCNINKLFLFLRFSYVVRPQICVPIIIRNGPKVQFLCRTSQLNSLFAGQMLTDQHKTTNLYYHAY